MPNHHSESAPSGSQESETILVDTAKIQEALEKRVDLETEMPDPRPHKKSGRKVPGEAKAEHTVGNRVWTPQTRSWFFTFMCMNMPVIGWFYLFHKARHEEDPARKEFARAYLFYKLVFLVAGLVVLMILIWIGLGLLDQLLAYMEML